MKIATLFANPVLWTALVAWFSAQTLKIPIEYLRKHRWNWGLFFSAGGMPSSHSCLMTAVALTIGLIYGFDTPLFGLAVAIAIVVVYDATGVRRQAGIQAKKINIIIEELLKGHPINQDHLREVIGHTPVEAVGGVVLGIIIAIVVWLIWK